MRRGRICRAVCPSLLSHTDILGKIQPTWKDLSLSLSLSRQLGFVGGVRLQRMKKRRDRVVFCARTTRVLAERGPMPRKPSGTVCPAQQFRTRLVHLLSPLLPNSPSFLSLAGGFPVRSSGQIRSRKDFLAANTLNEHQLGKLELERKVSIYGDGFVGIWVGCA